MVDEDRPEQLGSASWIEADMYAAGEEVHERATRFFAEVKWDALTSISSHLRNGLPCKYSGTYSFGHFNMVRHVQFADGASWVARVRLPELWQTHKALDVASILRVEIGSMRFLSQNSIPTPAVHSYCVDGKNEVGAPYILMGYVHGTTTRELSEARNCGPCVYGTPRQDRKFKEQMADIQVQLSSFKFDQIGSLYQDETSEFFIGPEVETGKGPWTSSLDYYADLANHLLEGTLRSSHPELKNSVSLTLPSVFQHLIRLYSQDRSMGSPFNLVNRDFGAHNLLVNEDFDISCVIDLDGVMAAPVEVIAQYTTRPGWIERLRVTLPPNHTQ